MTEALLPCATWSSTLDICLKNTRYFIENICIDQNKSKIFFPKNFDKIPHVFPGTEGKFGGSVALADYCPYIQEFSWRAKNVVVRGSHCYFEENNPRKL
jgi:hypothetical protein